MFCPSGTLNHPRHHLEKWGYTLTEIHGGMNPHERKRAQEDFRTSKQICVAAEAAGEGINLQFCRLMINYDLLWNPTRLEQRLGRIHRIGQERDVHAFNFVAAESEEGQEIVEGKILARLLQKLEQMRAVLADRVFDVVGEVLSLNDVNLPEMLREAAHDPRRLEEYLDRIHFFEISVRGQNTKGDNLTLYGEVVPLRENVGFPLTLGEMGDGESRFTIIPADCLLDLPALPNAPASIGKLDVTPACLPWHRQAADFIKSTYQTEKRQACQDDRRKFVQVCREYLEKSFNARLRAAQDRVMSLRAREAGSPDLPAPRPNLFFVYAVECEDGSHYIGHTDDLHRRWDEHRTGQGADWTRTHKAVSIAHLKIGFDVRSLGPADPQTGYRDPVQGIRRIEVKGRKRGQPVRLTVNEWYHAVQLGDTYWLYVVWNPLDLPAPSEARQAGNPFENLLIIRNPAKHLDHAKKEVVAARYFDIPAAAIEETALKYACQQCS